MTLIPSRGPIPPLWLTLARSFLGTAEIPGPRHNATILGWLERLKAWWRDDETPWCGVFVAHCLREAGHEIPKLWMRARAWADWGISLEWPVVGCIVVFSRAGGGHVGFVVGRDNAGNLMVLGGNQGDRVSIAPFSPGRVIAYRWPADDAPPDITRPLPRLASDGKLSTNEV
ncbi:TIGR02594 family protein [Pseudomonas sp.]|uniref:TIGR02594 family protein n=1 Tax=Pseudomonas sp. TaxID=306 RepID=UPI003F360AD8